MCICDFVYLPKRPKGLNTMMAQLCSVPGFEIGDREIQAAAFTDSQPQGQRGRAPCSVFLNCSRQLHSRAPVSVSWSCWNGFGCICEMGSVQPAQGFDQNGGAGALRLAEDAVWMFSGHVKKDGACNRNRIASPQGWTARPAPTKYASVD